MKLLDGLHAKRDLLQKLSRWYGARRIRMLGSVVRLEEDADRDVPSAARRLMTQVFRKTVGCWKNGFVREKLLTVGFYCGDGCESQSRLISNKRV